MPLMNKNFWHVGWPYVRNTSDYKPHLSSRYYYRHSFVYYLYHTFPYLESIVLFLVWDYIQFYLYAFNNRQTSFTGAGYTGWNYGTSCFLDKARLHGFCYICSQRALKNITSFLRLHLVSRDECVNQAPNIFITTKLTIPV